MAAFSICGNKGSQNNIGKKNKKCRKLSRFLKSKLKHVNKKKSKKSNNSVDDFIKKHKQTDSVTNNMTNIKSLDIRRKVFVSLLGAYHSWQNCPSYILYSAILILPLKQDWIYNPSRHCQQFESDNEKNDNDLAKSCLFSGDGEFVELLKWKDSQGLLFCMLDEFESNDNNDLISPFWYNLSERLSNLYDPITGKNYKKINLDTQWWENKDKYETKYDVNTSSILAEFYFLTMKFKTMKEILYQSNPQSLHPIQSYKNSDCTYTPFVCYKLYKFDENGDNWWMSDEYDPYDLN